VKHRKGRNGIKKRKRTKRDKRNVKEIKGKKKKEKIRKCKYGIKTAIAFVNGSRYVIVIRCKFLWHGNGIQRMPIWVTASSRRIPHAVAWLVGIPQVTMETR
jgi:hypothetical protein